MNIDHISEEQKEVLILKFDSLVTIKEKLSFWENDLNISYIDALKSFDSLFPKDWWILKFRIIPIDSLERKELNLHFLEFIEKEKLIGTTFNSLVRDFESEIDSVKNKKLFIDAKIEAIDKHVINDDLKKRYSDYLVNELEFDLSEKCVDVFFLRNIMQVQEWAKYRLYLDGIVIKKEKLSNKKQDLTTAQKLLLFEQLGFYSLFERKEELQNLSNKDRAEILALLFGNDGSENIRQYLSKIFELPRVNNNLEVVNNILKKYSLDEIKRK